MENKIRGAFDGVRADERLKAATAQYLRQQCAKGGQWERTRRSAGWVRGLAALCAVAAVVIIGGVWRGMVCAPVSYIGVDVNPSAELALNRFDRVVSVTARNEEGAVVLDALELEGRLYDEAVETLLGSQAMAPYLVREDAQLVLTVAADGARQARLLEGVGECAGQFDEGGVCRGADVADVAAAHSCGMSLGKYVAWQTLSEYGQVLTQEECHEMTTGELYERIHACEDGEHHGYETPVESVEPAQDVAPVQEAVPDTTPEQPTQSVGGHHSHGHHGSGHE